MSWVRSLTASTVTFTAAASIVLTAAPVAARAGVPPPTAQRLLSVCGRARALLSVTRTARNERLSGVAAYKDLAESTVEIPPMPGFGMPVACATAAPAPVAIDVRSGGMIPGENLAALAAVLDYRSRRAWPSGPAHPDHWNSEIRLETRGSYDYVSILDTGTAARTACAGEEFYRVDPHSFAVAPYRGCTVAVADRMRR